MDSSQGKEKFSFLKSGSGKVAAGLAALVLIVLFAMNCYVVIPTGYTGVRSTMGQISEKVMMSGVRFKLPVIQTVEKVNNKQQDIIIPDKVWSETKSRTAVYFEGVTVTYRISPEKSAWVLSNVTDYRNSLITSSLVASAVKSASKDLGDVDVTNRSIIEPKTMETLQTALDEKYGPGVVTVNRIIIGNADFDESYNQAIAEKQRAQLSAEQQAIDNQKAIDKAEADATVERTKAQAAADAEVIRAKGQADANREIQESLSKEVLENKKLEKWNGELPRFVSGGGSSVMIGFDEDSLGGETEE